MVAVIATGGALGSLGRWGLAQVLSHEPGALAWSTVVANVSGSFALGALMVLVVDAWPTSRYLRPFLGVGVLGGFTTFSTAMLDLRVLLVEDEPVRAVGYVVVTLVLGLVAAWMGLATMRALSPRLTASLPEAHPEGGTGAR
jgi:CrcB protein